MESTNQVHPVGTAAKVGAVLFVLWGVLHLWVGFEGVHQYLVGGARGMWSMLLGGAHAPRAAFQHASDPMTLNAQAHLLLNFVIDVAGYGALGVAIAPAIWSRGSWSAYLLGVFIIGIADLTFLFAMVTSGIIEFSFETLAGPMIWALACAVTPFGLRRRSAAPAA
jgi:hypothetical protein